MDAILIEFALVVSLTLLAYTYVGYPLLLWVLARSFPLAVRRQEYQPFVTVIIVVYNEEKRIAAKIETCMALDYPREKLRVLVASDGSEDGTNEVVAGFADREVRLLAFPSRRGKAACLNDAVAKAEGEIVLFTDARQRLDPNAVKYLVENFADPSVGAVSGELEFETEGMSSFGGGVDSYWRYEKFIRQQESRLHSVVGVTGALYALRRDCFQRIPDDTILDDVVIPMNAAMTGKRILFESRAKAFDLPSRDTRQEKVRKVRTIAGNYQMLVSNPEFLMPWRNPIFLQLISHKVLRLLGPLCMGILLISNIWLASTAVGYQILLGAQLAAYALPVIGAIWPGAGQFKIVKLANAFLVLNWFAVLGAVEYFRNRNAHLWDAKRR